MKKILILANETIAGKRMLDAMVAHRGEDGDQAEPGQQPHDES